MRKNVALRKKAWLAAVSALSIFVAIVDWTGIEGTEFSGGIVTGPVLHALELGIVLLILGLVLLLFSPRAAALVMLLASVICLPFYLYFLAPGPFRQVFPGEYKAPMQGNFIWAPWDFFGLMTLLMTIFIATYSFALQNEDQNQ
jgi:hypothetical protein